jgi:RNase H-fold protein (predicted Holliday junction resolvase)
MKVIIGIDVGKKGGIAVMNDQKQAYCEAYNMTSLFDTYNYLFEIMLKYQPDAVITGKPNRMYNVIMAHAQFIGVIAMLCEESNIPLVIENDSTMRAFIFGKGNGMKKELVQKKYNGQTPDVSDAMMFADYLFKRQNES